MNPDFIQRNEINISPKVADIAFTSINRKGNIGELNKYVYNELGYDAIDIPTHEQLKEGFFLLQKANKIPIIFIVTIDGPLGNTESNLFNNLKSAIEVYYEYLIGKKIWVPLMGTGMGNLTLSESYYCILRSITKADRILNHETVFVFSFPDTEQARILIKSLDVEDGLSNLESYIDQEFKRLKSKNIRYWAGGFGRGEEYYDRLNEFKTKNYWQALDYEDDGSSVSENAWNLFRQIKIGDRFIIKGYGGNHNLIVHYLGEVIGKNEDEGRLDFRKIEGEYYRGKAPRGEGAGVWFNTLLEITREEDIRRLFIPLISTQNGIEDVLENSGSFQDEEIVTIRTKSRIAILNNDSDKGEDHLGISKDVTAFAKIIASKSFSPPVAIALFGDWGTGKSFFMNKLKDKISSLSGSKNPSYCEGVVQIHFNAWSYLDANLWASLVTQIFQKLNEYIKNDQAEPEVKKELEKRLKDDLTISKEQQLHLKKQKDENVSKLKELRHAKSSLKGELQAKIESIKDNTLVNVLKEVNNKFDVEEKITSALDNNQSLIQIAKEVKDILPEEYRKNPLSLYHEVNSKATFIREFFKKDKIWINLSLITVISIGILIIPPLLQALTSWAKNVNFSTSQFLLFCTVILVPLVRRIQVTYRRLQPIISAFWNIKEEYDKQILNAINEFEQKEKATRLTIEQKEKELEFIEANIQEAKKTISILEFKINNTLSTEALYEFIDKRTNSDDYKKHLGIISSIRKDFEILSQLFIEHTKEKELLKFREILNRPLQRIVLYIDDLDRCPESQVIEVLEAVNLLMAFPLFVVVVGVDPRWVKNALVKKYHFQFSTHMDESIRYNLIEIDSSNYLEKIFQIPFHIKVASDDSIKDMIGKIGRAGYENTKKENQSLKLEDHISVSEKISIKVISEENNKIINEIENVETQSSSFEDDEYLVLSEGEIGLMQGLSEVIGSNPRAIKRFVNVYKIVKAHEGFVPVATGNSKEYMILMLLLAIPIGPYRKVSPCIYQFIKNDKTLSLNSFFEEHAKSTFKREILGQEVIDCIGELHKVLLRHKSEELLTISADEMKKYCQFIRRFSFENVL